VSRGPEVATRAGIAPFAEAGAPGALDALLAGTGAWEVELGFGKGRFLLAAGAARPERRFLGIEVAGEYFRLAAARLARRGLPNVVLLRGEALALLATALPARFAERLHVYFPDPWPKARHARRRLLSPATLDLVLRPLAAGGTLEFATDHPGYGAEVERLLEGVPQLAVRSLDSGWPEGPRTNYETKFVARGRPIVRLVARLAAPAAPHPAGLAGLLVGYGAAAAEPERAAAAGGS
jgi:tRNA (guanine-N7-)-methyltransferase